MSVIYSGHSTCLIHLWISDRLLCTESLHVARETPTITTNSLVLVNRLLITTNTHIYCTIYTALLALSYNKRNVHLTKATLPTMVCHQISQLSLVNIFPQLIHIILLLISTIMMYLEKSFLLVLLSFLSQLNDHTSLKRFIPLFPLPKVISKPVISLFNTDWLFMDNVYAHHCIIIFHYTLSSTLSPAALTKTGLLSGVTTCSVPINPPAPYLLYYTRYVRPKAWIYKCLAFHFSTHILHTTTMSQSDASNDLLIVIQTSHQQH